MPPTCQSTPLRRAVLGKRGCPWWKKNEQETHTPENRRQWLRSGLKVDPRTAQGLQNLSKWSQNGSQRRSKINELSDFTKNVKRHKNNVRNKHFQEFVRLKNHDFSNRSALKTLSQRRTSQKGVRVTTLVPQNALMDVIRTIFDPKGSPTDPAVGGQMNVGSVCKTCKSSFSARSHPLPQNVCSGGGPPRGKR